MRVRFSAAAAKHLSSIQRYLRRESPKAANDVVLKIEKIASLLGDQPEAGHPTQAARVRVITVPGYRYRIFYTIQDGSEIYILRIRHTSRRPHRDLS